MPFVVSSQPESSRQALIKFIPWMCLGLIIFIAVQPLFGSPPRGADLLLHYYRVPLLNEQLSQGILFSRWSPDLIFGYGYPLFNFYPPLSAFLLTLVSWLTGHNLLIGWNLTEGLILAAAGIGMFLLGRRLFGAVGGVFAAAAFVLSPVMLYQIYERSSLSNALALAWAPYALLALLNVATGATARRIGWAAIAIAGLLLSHLSTAMLLTVPIIGAGMIVALVADRHGARKRVAGVLLAALGGLALAAFVWLPALGEIRDTQYQTAIAGVEPSLFFADAFRWPPPPLDGLANPDLPQAIGVVQVGLGVIGLGVASVSVIRRRRQPIGWWNSTELLIIYSGFMGLIGIFFATPVSTWLWRNWPLLLNFQFPARWLDLAVFWLALPCGWLMARFIANGNKWRVALSLLALGVVCANALPYVYPLRWRTDLPAQPTLTDLTRQAQQQYGIYGLTSWGEYAPATVTNWPAGLPFPGADAGATLDQKLDRAQLPVDAVITSSGGPTSATIQLNLPRQHTLAFYTFYFPGWQAKLDGRAITVEPDDLGRIRVTVPAGQHALAVFFGETPLRAIADLASIVAVGFIGLALWSRPFSGRRLTEKSGVDSPHMPAIAGWRILLIWCGVLSVLLAVKLVWFDQTDSPVVHHVQNEQVPGAVAPAHGNFGGELKLLGYRLVDQDHLDLYWEAIKTPAHDYQIEVRLMDARGTPTGRIVHTAPGASLTSRWEVGQLVRDDYVLPLQHDQPPIGYYLSVAVIDPVDRKPLPLIDSPDGEHAISLGTTKLAPQIANSSPPGAQAVGAVFGNVIALERAAAPDVVAVGATLPMTLVWKSLAAASTDYTVFVHLLNRDGTLASSGDGQPRAGLYPTSFWSPGEQVVDEHGVPLAVAPGEYQLEVGLYNLATGERLHLAGGEDRVLLKTIQVTQAAGR
jgi:hypothetical protein